MASSKNEKFLYKCAIEIKLPTVMHAQNAFEVLNVDEEIGDRVTKSLEVVDNILKVDVASSDAKMLRVSISSFYDMVTVYLKCYQEFQ